MNPTREMVAAWLVIAGDVTATDLVRSLAMSNVLAAFAQLHAAVDVLTKELEARPRLVLLAGGKP